MRVGNLWVRSLRPRELVRTSLRNQTVRHNISSVKSRADGWRRMVLSSWSVGVTFLFTKMIRGSLSLLDPRTKSLSFCDDKHFPTSWKREGHGFLAMEFKSLYNEIQDTQVDLLHQDASVHQPSALNDLLGGSTCMDVDVDSVEAELNGYTRVQQVPLDTDPLMWWKQHVQEFPRLTRMARQHLTVPATSASPERLFSSVGLVKSDLRGRLLDSTLIDVMWAKQAPWTQLEREQLEWHTHTHTHTRTYTHLPLCHGHTLLIVTDTHQHIDRGLYTYMTSYLAQPYRLSILIDKPTLFINSSLIRLSVDNVLLINTRNLSIVIDKPIPLSIGISTISRWHTTVTKPSGISVCKFSENQHPKTRVKFDLL